jgi:hypothetical protein
VVCPFSVVAQQARDGAPATAAVRASLLPDSAFGTIQGYALNWNNTALPDSLVRLRDARYGGIIGTQLTGTSGMFTFRAVDPGTYVVELMGKDQTTALAASQLLTVGAGETVSAVVKLPFRAPLFGGLFGHTTQQAMAVISAAAASGVLVASVTGVDASAR